MLRVRFTCILLTVAAIAAVKISPRTPDQDDFEAEVDEPKDFDWSPKPEWLTLEPPSVREGRVKVGIMMLAGRKVDNPGMWTAWLNQADKDESSYNFLIHGKDGLKYFNRSRVQKRLRKYVMNGRMGTVWGFLMPAEYMIMETMLEDENVTHLILVSGDSVPLKPLRYIIDEIQQNPNSRFCAADQKVPPRAEMWWLLRRRDALLFRDHKELISGRDRVSADEKVWYYPLLLRQQHLGEEKAGITKQCIMFTDWQTNLSTRHTWGEHIEQCNCPSLLTESQTGAEASHPNSYATLGKDSVTELIYRSPFWFARKFQPYAESEEAVAAAADLWRGK